MKHTDIYSHSINFGVAIFHYPLYYLFEGTLTIIPVHFTELIDSHQECTNSCFSMNGLLNNFNFQHLQAAYQVLPACIHTHRPAHIQEEEEEEKHRNQLVKSEINKSTEKGSENSHALTLAQFCDMSSTSQEVRCQETTIEKWPLWKHVATTFQSCLRPGKGKQGNL